MRSDRRHAYRVVVYGRDYGIAFTRRQARETAASWRRLWPKSHAYCRRSNKSVTS